MADAQLHFGLIAALHPISTVSKNGDQSVRTYGYRKLEPIFAGCLSFNSNQNAGIARQEG